MAVKQIFSYFQHSLALYFCPGIQIGCFNSRSLHLLSNAYDMMRVFSHVCHIFMFLHCFGHNLSVCLDENKHTGRHLPTLFRLVCFLLLVCAFIKLYGFFLWALSSKRLLSWYALSSKLFLLLMCAYIKSLLFLCEPTSKRLP